MSTKDLAKYFLTGLFLIFAIIIIVVLINNPPNGTLICRMESAPSEAKTVNIYKMKFKFWQVTTFSSEEIVTSDDTEYLNAYKESMKNNNSKYIKTESMSSDNKITFITSIDYDKIKKDKKGINTSIKINHLKKAYINIGATCRYE